MSEQSLYAIISVHDAAAAVDFYKHVFGARELFRLTEPSGRIGHVELDFNGTTLMIADEYPEFGLRGPKAIGATGVTLHLHVDDADAVIARAVEANATVDRPAQDQFYGERSGYFFDPFGHRWNIGHSIEALQPDEMQERYTQMMSGDGK
jgi:PhnB protein